LKIIKSITNYFAIVLPIVGGAITILIGLYLLSITKNNLGSIIFGLLILSYGLVCFYYVVKYDKIDITENKLILKTLMGRTKKKINLEEFYSYAEIEKENKSYGISHMKWKDLTLIGEDITYKISSTSHKNYTELRANLIKNLKRDKIFEQEWERKNSLQWGYGLTTIELLLIGLIFRNGIPSDELLASFFLIALLSAPIIFGIYLIRKNRKVSK